MKLTTRKYDFLGYHSVSFIDECQELIGISGKTLWIYVELMIKKIVDSTKSQHDFRCKKSKPIPTCISGPALQYRCHCCNTVKPCVGASGCVCVSPDATMSLSLFSVSVWTDMHKWDRKCEKVMRQTACVRVCTCWFARLVSFLFFISFVDHKEHWCHRQYNRGPESAELLYQHRGKDARYNISMSTAANFHNTLLRLWTQQDPSNNSAFKYSSSEYCALQISKVSSFHAPHHKDIIWRVGQEYGWQWGDITDKGKHYFMGIMAPEARGDWK